MDQQLRQIELLKARGEPERLVRPLELAWKRRNGILLDNPGDVCWTCVIDTIPETKKKQFKKVWQASQWDPTKPPKNIPKLLNRIGDWRFCGLCDNPYAASTLDIANMGFWEGVGKDKLAGEGFCTYLFPGCVMSSVTLRQGSVSNIQQITYTGFGRDGRDGEEVTSFEFTCFCEEYEWAIRCRMPCGNWTGVVGWVDEIPHAHPFSVNVGHWEIQEHYQRYVEYLNSREDDPKQYIPQAR